LRGWLDEDTDAAQAEAQLEARVKLGAVTPNEMRDALAGSLGRILGDYNCIAQWRKRGLDEKVLHQLVFAGA
jgi:hypothetical protein